MKGKKPDKNGTRIKFSESPPADLLNQLIHVNSGI
jgi:hypothetical protein